MRKHILDALEGRGLGPIDVDGCMPCVGEFDPDECFGRIRKGRSEGETFPSVQLIKLRAAGVMHFIFLELTSAVPHDPNGS